MGQLGCRTVQKTEIGHFVQTSAVYVHMVEAVCVRIVDIITSIDQRDKEINRAIRVSETGNNEEHTKLFRRNVFLTIWKSRETK